MKSTNALRSFLKKVKQIVSKYHTHDNVNHLISHMAKDSGLSEIRHSDTLRYKNRQISISTICHMDLNDIDSSIFNLLMVIIFIEIITLRISYEEINIHCMERILISQFDNLSLSQISFYEMLMICVRDKPSLTSV